MCWFFSTERRRRARDLKERIRRDWFAINKFAKEQGFKQGLEQGKAQGKVETVVLIVKSRFPDEYSTSSDDVLSRLNSKSIPELNELIKTGATCASFQDFIGSL